METLSLCPLFPHASRSSIKTAKTRIPEMRPKNLPIWFKTKLSRPRRSAESVPICAAALEAALRRAVALRCLTKRRQKFQSPSEELVQRQSRNTHRAKRLLPLQVLQSTRREKVLRSTNRGMTFSKRNRPSTMSTSSMRK